MRLYKHISVLVADIFLIAFAFFASVFVVDLFTYNATHFSDITQELPIVIIVYIFTFEFLNMYKSLWKYASVEELLRGLIANVIAINVSYLLIMILRLTHFNYAYYLVAFFFALMLTVGMRLSYRIVRYYKIFIDSHDGKERTLIIGAGQAGVMLFEEINQNEDFEKHVIGFLDDKKSYIGSRIRGIPVLGTTDDVCQVAYDNKIDIIIIAIPSLPFEEMKILLNKVQATGCQIKLMPPFYEMIGKSEDLLKVRDVRIEDLLGREPINLDKTGIDKFVQGKTIVVTGGGGSIGSELVRQLRYFEPQKLIIIDNYENGAYEVQMELEHYYRTHKEEVKPEIIVLIASVRDRKRMEQIFEEYKPHVVFHAAAHKHVPLMEVSPCEAIKNNVIGTYFVATTSIKFGVEKFVLISTDKAVRPTNVMGASKRMAEKVVMALNDTSDTDFSAVRFGNVLGSNGSVIPLFRKQIEDGGPVTVTHPEITRYFMTIPEACQLVIQSGAYAKGGELFVLDMGEPVKILDLAEKMIRLSGKEPHKEISIEFTGLRPGEKMYEELLLDLNNVHKTDNDAIFIEKHNNGYDTIIEEVEYVMDQKCNVDIDAFIKKNVRSYTKKQDSQN